jgi:hypothetical protein
MLSRDMEEFLEDLIQPKVGQLHALTLCYEIHPIIFRYMRVDIKDNKLLYFKQMGEWYVRRMHSEISDGTDDSNNTVGKDVVGLCCSAEPLSLFRQRSVIPQGQSDH